MDPFLDTPIPPDHMFINAPHCRTRREAAQHYLDHTHFTKLQYDEKGQILHHITHPFTLGSITDRQVTRQSSGTICKSVRIGRSDLANEKSNLEQVLRETSVPVPRPHRHFESDGFEHLVMDSMPGTTLEQVWPRLSHLERESVADQVVLLIQKLRELHSAHIKTTLVLRRPVPASLKDVTDLNMERIKPSLSNEHIVAFVKTKSAMMEQQSNVFTHGDLDSSNILIADKRVCGLIDLESSGFFPPYWEWMMVRRLLHTLPGDSWFHLLEARLGFTHRMDWQAMWEVEQLIMALDTFSQWALTPAGRQTNQARGWAEVVRIVGVDVGKPPAFTYEMATKHPWWLISAPHS
ncbi:kinaselike domain [Fusarium sporotrichioides]|uniref:Kinaselike domain n=1 Tax=Fusarium sporotrichioides TaxID=5514 RepID=A0A395RTL6_FUSSP|nr:kinaselike domain [Fusarium sporotrichioides]